jgi:hypothetical protein
MISVATKQRILIRKYIDNMMSFTKIVVKNIKENEINYLIKLKY